MESQIQLKAIRKLAVAGEQAGFTLDQMIQLLNSGMSVVTLLDLIAWRLGPSHSSFESVPIGLAAQSATLVRSRNDCS
jgi:lipid-binding SYLF domain-containing protein